METNKEVFMKRLKTIAQELGLSLEDNQVPLTYFNRYPEGVSNEVADEIFPIWFPK